jgi:peptidoglycan/xylan/chitin deacetylase (PgdA/CDA1 family)
VNSLIKHRRNLSRVYFWMKPSKSTLKRIAIALVLILSASIQIPIPSRAEMPIDPGWDGTLRRLRVPVLMYHYISNPPADADAIRLDLSVTPANFRKQLQWLRENGYETISPDELAGALLRGAKLPARPILLTFDDGYADAYTNAFPILQELGFTGTFFVVTGFLDEGGGAYLTWDQAREMVEAGMYVENHSRSHKDMRARSHDWLVDQIQVPQERIEKNIGIRPRYFCYPSGGYDDGTVRELRAAGYMLAFTTADGTFAYTDNMLLVPRVRIRGSTTIEQFAHLMTWVR